MRLKNGFRMPFGGNNDTAIHRQQFPDHRDAACGMAKAPVQRGHKDGGGGVQWLKGAVQATDLRNHIKYLIAHANDVKI